MKRDISAFKLRNNMYLDNIIEKSRNNTKKTKSEENQNILNTISDENNNNLPSLTANNTRERFRKDNKVRSNTNAIQNIFFINKNKKIIVH